MKIRLSEIPAEGRQYVYDRKHGELDAELSDLIGKRDYAVDMFIRPIGNAYELRGSLKTSTGEICSSCGYDFEQPIDKKVSEVLFEDNEEYRKAHSVHGNQAIDYDADGPGATPYRNGIFDAGAYVHEQIALEEPLYPMCGLNGTCLHENEAKEILRRLEEEFAAADVGEKPNPFAVLKGLELAPRKPSADS